MPVPDRLGQQDGALVQMYAAAVDTGQFAPVPFDLGEVPKQAEK